MAALQCTTAPPAPRARWLFTEHLCSSYDNLPRKRHHRSPSDAIQETSSAVRASVLRDGSRNRPSSDPEMHYHANSAMDPREMSPKPEDSLSFGHSSPPAHRYDESPVDNGLNATSTASFDRTAAVDPPAAEGNNIGTPDSRHSSSSSVNLETNDSFAEGMVQLS